VAGDRLPTAGAAARRALGAAGERAAAAWYEARCRAGELDLVVGVPGLVVFCEVKSRRTVRFGAPFEAVTVAKQRRIHRLGMQWLREHPQGGAEVRFDVASVFVPRDEPPRIEVLEGVF
jgi:putative endonuclease